MHLAYFVAGVRAWFTETDGPVDNRVKYKIMDALEAKRRNFPPTRAICCTNGKKICEIVDIAIN